MSGYFTHSRIFSCSCWPSAVGCSRLAMTICWAACSVMSVEMMQVIRIMMTTPFSISSLTR